MAVAYAEVALVSGRTEDGVRMGEEIEAIRKEHGLTQQQVADGLGLKLSTYLSYRRGYIEIRPTPKVLQKWADALNIPVVEFARRLEIPLLREEPAGDHLTAFSASPPDLEAAIRAAGNPPSRVAMLAAFLRRYPAMTPGERRLVDGLIDATLQRIARPGEPS